MNMEGVYVLKLKDGRYYVGWSSDIPRRIRQHEEGDGSQWTKKYPPEQILEIRIGCTKNDETFLTRAYMHRYGVENVRGGIWCSISLRENPLIVTDERFSQYE